MLTGEFKLVFEEGLHARPASELVKLCQNTSSAISLIKDGHKVNPKSMLGVMSLGAAKDDVIVVEVDGADETEVFERLKNFFETVK